MISLADMATLRVWRKKDPFLIDLTCLKTRLNVRELSEVERQLASPLIKKLCSAPPGSARGAALHFRQQTTSAAGIKLQLA